MWKSTLLQVSVALCLIVIMTAIIDSATAGGTPECNCDDQAAQAIKAQRRQLRKLKKKINAQGQLIDNLEQTAYSKAAFEVEFIDPPIEITMDSFDTFKYDVVKFNLGNGYNSSTGQFTAPYDGMYVFATQTLSRKGVLDVEIVKASGNQSTTLASARAGAKLHSGSAFVVAPLMAGDTVEVRQTGGSKKVRTGPWNSFTGFLLKAYAAAVMK